MSDVVVANKPIGSGLGAQRYVDEITQDWSGPARHLAEETARLGALQWQHFTVTRLAPTVGAELSGVDLSNLSDAEMAEIHQALLEYKVIFFRDQPISSEQHVAFARRFGDLEIHPFITGPKERPELVRFEKSAEVAGYENSWHHDVTWRAVPSKVAVLHSITIPEVGGDTLFSDMYATYESLSDEIKAKIEGRTALHDFVPSFGKAFPADRMAEMRERYPVVEHPIVVRHPETGRRLLYVNRNFTTQIVGMDPEESTLLLRLLCRQAGTVEHQCRFRWTENAVAIWDNMAVQHYASSDYWPNIRVMERASVIGTRPAA
jgi:taurine dioxygenase